jgi:hypothetical protein
VYVTAGTATASLTGPIVQLTVEPGQTRRFSADIPRQRMVLARIMRGMFDPFHSLSLEEVIA